MKTVPSNSTNISNAVREFVASARSTPLDKITLNKSLFHDLGVDGDDAIDLLNGFSVQFNVNLAGFDFRKYFGDEVASNPLAFIVELLTKEKSEKLQRLEIADLIQAALDGKFPGDAEI